MERFGMKTKNISKDYSRYLLKRKLYKVMILAMQFSLLAILIGAWEILAQTKVIDTFITSCPSRIFRKIVELFSAGTIWNDMFVTLYEAVVAFIISTLGGTLLAIILWWNQTIRRVLEPYIIVLNSLPKVALGPIIILIVGVNIKAIVTMAILIMIVLSTINMLNAFCAIDDNKILLLKSMGANKLQILFRLVLPHSLPDFISLLKINVGLTWVGTIMGEYLVSYAGLGYQILLASQVFNIDMVMACTFLLCVLACVMYLIVAWIEKIVVGKYKK